MQCNFPLECVVGLSASRAVYFTKRWFCRRLVKEDFEQARMVFHNPKPHLRGGVSYLHVSKVTVTYYNLEKGVKVLRRE